MQRLRKYLLNHQVAPKWMVFIFDTFIGAFSVAIAYFLRFNLDFEAVITESAINSMLLVVLTNTLFFYIFKTYQGIIRFSGFAEAVRTTIALFASCLILMVGNLVMKLSGHLVLVPGSVLMINMLTASFMMVGYRLAVKNIYRNSIAKGNDLNVVIYGAEMNGSKLKATIEQASNYQYKVIAFIDEDLSFVGKTIDNARIYSFHQVKHLLKNWDVRLLLFARNDIEMHTKNNVVDFCLEHDIQVRNIPPVDQWIKGHLYLTQLREINIDELLGRTPIKVYNEKATALMSQSRILVTGAAGSIGSELSRQLATFNPPQLILADQNETGLYELEYFLRNNVPSCENITIYVGDVRDGNSMENLFKRFRPDIVYHAAAYKHVPMMEYHPSEAIRNNVLGTRILADLSVEYNVERFVLVSTDKAINPTNVMGASKRIAEIYVQSLGSREKKVVHLTAGSRYDYSGRYRSTKFITTRFGNVLGSNGSVIPRFKEQIADGGPLTVTHPDIIRFFMTIPEACNLVVEAATMGEGGETYVFDMGEPVKIADLARKMIKLAGYVPGKDIEIKFTGLRPGEKLFEELLNKKESVQQTYHDKILIGRVPEYDYYQINQLIDTLIELAYRNDDEDVVRQMKRIVPEFKSKNSIYQHMDGLDNPNVAISS